MNNARTENYRRRVETHHYVDESNLLRVLQLIGNIMGPSNATSAIATTYFSRTLDTRLGKEVSWSSGDVKFVPRFRQRTNAYDFSDKKFVLSGPGNLEIKEHGDVDVNNGKTSIFVFAGIERLLYLLDTDPKNALLLLGQMRHQTLDQFPDFHTTNPITIVKNMIGGIIPLLTRVAQRLEFDTGSGLRVTMDWPNVIYGYPGSNIEDNLAAVLVHKFPRPKIDIKNCIQSEQADELRLLLSQLEVPENPRTDRVEFSRVKRNAIQRSGNLAKERENEEVELKCNIGVELDRAVSIQTILDYLLSGKINGFEHSPLGDGVSHRDELSAKRTLIGFVDELGAHEVVTVLELSDDLKKAQGIEYVLKWKEDVVYGQAGVAQARKEEKETSKDSLDIQALLHRVSQKTGKKVGVLAEFYKGKSRVIAREVTTGRDVFISVDEVRHAGKVLRQLEIEYVWTNPKTVKDINPEYTLEDTCKACVTSLLGSSLGSILKLEPTTLRKIEFLTSN